MKTKQNKEDLLVLAIHNEVDSAEERILKQCEEILSLNNIVTETNLERKALAMRELGFTSSETVKQYEEIEKKNKEVHFLKVQTKQQADYLMELKRHYPLDKFITIDELERICTKYNLIHAPVSNYIKDVPEKNVLDMKRAKPLMLTHKIEEKIRLVGIRDNTLLNAIGHPDGVFTQQEIIDLMIKYYGRDIPNWTENARSTTWLFVIAQSLGIDNIDCSNYERTERINYDGYFIAAPKSHFNLSDLTKKSKFGFFKVAVVEPKDPIVFEYCKNDFCRIITKWGTSDDQSYLDPTLTNEAYN